jgi:hypothetical protein
MARVAIGAVINVVPHTLVMLVRRCFQVTTRARKDTVVVRVRVTRTADPIGIAVVGREPGVIEGCTQPRGGGVAGIAGLWETCGHVIRIRGAVVFRGVARIAIGRCSGKPSVHVAESARCCRMLSRQRESRRRVIERRTGPIGGCVAKRTVRRETGCHVIRIRRLVVSRQVATRAGGTQACVLIIHVAGGTSDRRVPPGQRKLRRRMIEGRPGPIRRGMAQGTVSRKPRARVIRVRRGPIFGQVARIAACTQARIDTTGMTLQAGSSRVTAGQRECGLGGVVKRSRGPAYGGVTQGTGLRESGGYVIRILRRLVVLQVAGLASRTQSGILIVHMARGASNAYVFTCQREPRAGVVIECCRSPGSRGVAGLAVLRKTCCGVVRIRRLLVIRQVAARARRTQTCIYAARMALRARRRRVAAGQWKSGGGVVIKYRRSPGSRRMARLTGLREAGRRMVRIGALLIVRQVATGASRVQPRIDAARMALCARRRRVAARQREFRIAVIKRRWCPARRRVAQSTILWETRRDVVRIHRLLIVR